MAAARLERELSFVAEIDPSDLERVKVVGKGSFGVVSKGRWNGKDVAIKYIETDEEKKAFRIEVRQLSRVDHPNIVKLYGACTAGPVCLVMEFAEGGSLFNVLHGKPPQPIYTCAHALSWVQQCALGVAYLHNMKPKALIHRDLKPANLLLMEGGTKLKICDFGTACDSQTYMTNNKGSAAWMAPEVFEGRIYNEKCDIFSWGVILWEVLSRKRPFETIDGSAFAIMWAIHQGKRPHRIRNLPKPLSELLNRCWDEQSIKRPSMDEVLQITTQLCKLVRGADVPLIFPNAPPQAIAAERLNPAAPVSLPTGGSTQGDSTHSTVSDTVIRSGDLNMKLPDVTDVRSTGRQDSSGSEGSGGVKLRVKHKDLDVTKRRSADILELEKARSEKKPSKSRKDSSSNLPLRSVSVDPGEGHIQEHKTSDEDQILNILTSELEPALQPLLPHAQSEESIQIYNSHCKLATELLKLQTERALLRNRKTELQNELSDDWMSQQDSFKLIEQYSTLNKEKERLTRRGNELRSELDIMRARRRHDISRHDPSRRY